MNTYSESVVPENRREEDFSHVLSSIVDPLLKLLEEYVSKLKTNEDATFRSDYFVYIINSYFLIWNTLGMFPFTTNMAEMVSTEMEKQLELFTQYQCKLILDATGLQEKLALLLNKDANTPLCQIEGSESLKNFFHQNFYTALFSLGSKVLTLQRHSCDRLLSSRLKSYTKNRIASEICQAYKILYQAIMDPLNGYENPREIVYHDPDQVKTLLDF